MNIAGSARPSTPMSGPSWLCGHAVITASDAIAVSVAMINAPIRPGMSVPNTHATIRMPWTIATPRTSCPGPAFASTAKPPATTTVTAAASRFSGANLDTGAASGGSTCVGCSGNGSALTRPIVPDLQYAYGTGTSRYDGRSDRVPASWRYLMWSLWHSPRRVATGGHDVRLHDVSFDSPDLTRNRARRGQPGALRQTADRTQSSIRSINAAEVEVSA